MNVPFAIADATALTEAGYVGEDGEYLAETDSVADYDIESRKRYYLYRDETDKITKKSENVSITEMS